MSPEQLFKLSIDSNAERYAYRKWSRVSVLPKVVMKD